MEGNANFISALFKSHAKPIVKEAMLEFLKENNLTLVSTLHVNSSRLLSTDDVAEMMGVNRHRVYEMIEQGLPAIQSKPYKFKQGDVDDFISRNMRSKIKTNC